MQDQHGDVNSFLQKSTSVTWISRLDFDPTALLLTVAALVHPGHKSLNWLTPRERENAIKQFKEELLNIVGVNTEPLEANMEVIEHSSVPTTQNSQIPLDSYFDFEASQFHFFVQI